MNNYGLWSLGLNIIILLVSVGGFIKIMKNDLTHLQKGLDKLTETVDHLFVKVNSLCQRVAKIEGKLERNK